jgi:hypothetical protein
VFSSTLLLREGIKGQHAHMRSVEVVVSYLVALPQPHSQFTLIFKLPSAPVGAHFFWVRFRVRVRGLDGGARLFSSVQLRLVAFVVAERLVRGWMRDEVCGGVCRGEARMCEGIGGVGIGGVGIS